MSQSKAKTSAIISLLFLSVFKLVGQNQVPWTDEQVSHDVDYGLNNGFSTSITTYNDNIYYTFVGDDLKIYVGKKTSAGHQVFAVWSDLQSDRNHSKPSIAIDKNGYIHVTGDMHNQPWRYYISDNPEDITSWSKQSLPGGQKVTYPEIYKDRNRDLFILYRIRNTVGIRERRDHVGAMIKYDVDSQEFVLLGGTAYDSDEPIPAIVSGLGNGGQGCWYQQPRPRIYFDTRNRMHLTASVIDGCLDELDGDGDYNNQSHVIYAYSDDGGQTFNRADGTIIEELPLSKDNASVVINRSSEQDIVPVHQIGAFNTNTPVISYGLNNGLNYSMKWNGNAWVNLNVPDNTAKLMAHKSGVIAWYHKYETGNARFQITADGEIWEELNASGDGTPNRFSETMDREYFDQTGDFRIHTVSFYKSTPRTNIHTFQTGATVLGLDPVDSIKTIKVPTAVVPGGTGTVKVKYTSSTERDVVVVFQLDHPPWTPYGSTVTKVSEGTRAIDIDIDISINTPIAMDDYKFMAYITEDGGNFAGSFNARQIANIDCISPELMSTRANTVLISSEGESFNSQGELEKESIHVFPNPVTDQVLHLELPFVRKSPLEVKLIDLQGKVMLKRIVNTSLSFIDLDLKNFSNGMYMMTVEGEGNKLVLEKIAIRR